MSSVAAHNNFKVLARNTKHRTRQWKWNRGKDMCPKQNIQDDSVAYVYLMICS